jgi:hypothetical protein
LMEPSLPSTLSLSLSDTPSWVQSERLIPVKIVIGKPDDVYVQETEHKSD